MLPTIKQWRQEEQDAGRPSGLHDFFRIHGLCFECKTTGLDLSPIGWDGGTSLHQQCDVCGGTGKIATQEK
jgi:DnaJ-class molecular chaperone